MFRFGPYMHFLVFQIHRHVLISNDVLLFCSSCSPRFFALSSCSFCSARFVAFFLPLLLFLRPFFAPSPCSCSCSSSAHWFANGVWSPAICGRFVLPAHTYGRSVNFGTNIVVILHVIQSIENLDVSADSFRALDVLTTRLSEAIGQQETVACASVIKDAMQSIEELKNSGAVAEQEGVAMRLIEIETRTCSRLMDVLEADVRMEIERSVDDASVGHRLVGREVPKDEVELGGAGVVDGGPQRVGARST